MPRFGWAQSPTGPVVVLHSGQNAMTVRLVAELSAVGCSSVLLLHSNDSLWADQVRDIMKPYRAAALINAVSLTTRVDIWIPAYGDDGTQLMVDTVDASEEKGDFAAIILKIVETLRADLMHLGKAPEKIGAGPKDNATSLPKTAGTPPSPGRLSLALGPAVTYGFGDFPVQWQVLLSARLYVAPLLDVELFGIAPTLPATLATQYGKARIWSGSLIAGLRFRMRPPEKRAVPWAALGVGPHFARMKGDAVSPYIDGDDRTAVFEILFRLGLRLRLNQIFFMEIAVYTGDCHPEPKVVIGEKVASFARPLFGGTVQLGARLF